MAYVPPSSAGRTPLRPQGQGGKLGTEPRTRARQPRGRMDEDAIIQYIAETLAGVEVVRGAEGVGAGDTFCYYGPERDADPSRGLPFATIVTKDCGEFDNASNLDRVGVFRLNIGVSRESFRSLFGRSPSESDAPSTGFDCAALDRLMPHPVYARHGWVCAQPEPGDLRDGQAPAGRGPCQGCSAVRRQPEPPQLSDLPSEQASGALRCPAAIPGGCRWCA